MLVLTLFFVGEVYSLFKLGQVRAIFKWFQSAGNLDFEK